MLGTLTTEQIFWIVIFLIVLLVFVGIAMWSKGYGLDVISSIFHLTP